MTKTREEKIEEIYKEIAQEIENDGSATIGEDGKLKPITVILPVLIGDVLDCIGNAYNSNRVVNGKLTTMHNIVFEILGDWKEKRLPIEEQSEECITYIYNLINKGT